MLSEEEKKAIEYLENRLDILHNNTQWATEKSIKVVLNLTEKQQKEIEERDKYNITTLPFEELKEMIEQNKNISIFGKKYISKDKIIEVLKDLDEFDTTFFNASSLKEAIKNSLQELLEEN